MAQDRQEPVLGVRGRLRQLLCFAQVFFGTLAFGDVLDNERAESSAPSSNCSSATASRPPTPGCSHKFPGTRIVRDDRSPCILETARSRSRASRAAL